MTEGSGFKMGRFVNPDNSAFQVALNSKIYVDKTALIEYTNSVLDTTDAYICNSRPHRFGKSYTAKVSVFLYRMLMLSWSSLWDTCKLGYYREEKYE